MSRLLGQEMGEKCYCQNDVTWKCSHKIFQQEKKPRSNLYVTTDFSLGPNPVAAWLASMASMAKNKTLPTLTRNER